jgi:hypothetical protein
MASPETVYSGHRSGMNEKVTDLMNIFSTNQTLSNKRRQRKRMELSDFDSMGDDEAADYALMEEEEKLMMIDETMVNRRLMNEQVNPTYGATLETTNIKGPFHEMKQSVVMAGTKETNIKKDDHGSGVYGGTRARKLIGKPLPPPPTILVKIPEVANPITGGSHACSVQSLDLKGQSTTISTILGFKHGPQSVESVPVPNPILSSPERSNTQVDLRSSNSVHEDPDVNDVVDLTHSNEPIPQPVTSVQSRPPELEQTKSAVTGDEEILNRVRTYSVSFSFTETRDAPQTENVPSHSFSIPSTRKRAYSIDIDCKCFVSNTSVTECRYVIIFVNVTSSHGYIY